MSDVSKNKVFIDGSKAIDSYNVNTVVSDFDAVLSVEDPSLIPDALATAEWLLLNYFAEHGIDLKIDTFEAIRDDIGYWRWEFLGFLNVKRQISVLEVKFAAVLKFYKYRDNFSVKLEDKSGGVIYTVSGASSGFLNFPVCIAGEIDRYLKAQLEV